VGHDLINVIVHDREKSISLLANLQENQTVRCSRTANAFNFTPAAAILLRLACHSYLYVYDYTTIIVAAG
jgi:hypothetical protein